MPLPLLQSAGFAAAVIDSLASALCVVDRNGVITVVNEAWRRFALDRPPTPTGAGVGAHYLGVCRRAAGPGSEEAGPFADGLQSVLDGRVDCFRIEYPCHSPTELKWFQARITKLGTPQGGAVISHLDITDRRLLEFDLTRLAETDLLTGLPNRRFFQGAGDQEVERVRRFGAVASVIMFDLDRFKAINDTYGHSAGDEALRALARAGRAALRQIDVLARLGGEEFVVLLPGTGLKAGLDVAEKLRRTLAATLVESGGNSFRVTASFGVDELRPLDESIDDTLARADSALYAAKRGGRNRVCGTRAISTQRAARRA